MRSLLKISAGAVASIGLLASSTVAVAAAPAPIVHAGYQAPNAWLMLTALSPSSAGLVGSAAAVAQPTEVPPTDAPPANVPPADVPPPPPPPPVVATGGVSLGELLPIALWFGLIAVAFAATDDGGREAATGNPNSPA
ncbi:MAG TPA: hypothetical protein VF750_02990 [Sphingomicrobium sp.]